MKILMFGGIKNNLDQILRNQVWSWYYPDSLNKVFFPFFFFSLSPHFCPFQPPSPNPNTTWSSQKMDRSSLPLIWGWRELYIYRMGKKRQSLFDSNSFSCAGSSEGGVIHWGKGHKIKKTCAVVKYTLCGGWSHRTHSAQLPVAYFAAEHAPGSWQISEVNCWHLWATAFRNLVCCNLHGHHPSHCRRKVKLTMI